MEDNVSTNMSDPLDLPSSKIPRLEIDHDSSNNADNDNPENSSSMFDKIDEDYVLKHYEDERRYSMMESSLREFDIIDEAKDSDETMTDSSDYSMSDRDYDLADNEVDILLEKSLPIELQGRRKKISKQQVKKYLHKFKLMNGYKDVGECDDYDEEEEEEDDDKDKGEGCSNRKDEKNSENAYHSKKIVLEELEYNHFDLLPEGWLKVTHRSGMPVYLHRKSRVCTLTRPYYLGPGSVRNHSIPLSAVPCLQYKRALEKEKINRESIDQNSHELNTDMFLRKARIESVSENQATQSLDPPQLNAYCKSLFQFKTINLVKHRTWVARRKQEKEKKQEEQRKRMMLPDGTNLLKFPIIDPNNENTGRSNREWIMNPCGKSYVCILHEYVQHALKKQPNYEFQEIENPGTPYSASVVINGTQYGSATGASKKLAKLEAAKVALEILIPEMKDKINLETSKVGYAQNGSLSIFDEIRIEDPRVAEFCAKTTEPSPYAILLTCLQRNQTSSDVKVNYTVNNNEHLKNIYTMTVGSHVATILCKNKREGKQRSSQAILQALHPHITSWGSLLRLYGNRSVKNYKEKKQEEQEITLLQSKASLNQPNFAILDKLRSEMKKLRDKKQAMKPIGKFVPPDDITLPSLSSTDLHKISI